MGKKFAGMVVTFLVLFCFCVPTKGGQSDEHVMPVYSNIKATEDYYSEKKTRFISYKKTSTILVGKASWYGPAFHGKTTANVEIFDENALTAAQRIAFWYKSFSY